MVLLGAEGPSLRKRTVAVLHAILWVGLATAGRAGLKEGLQAEFDVAHAYHTFGGAFAQSGDQREDIGAAGIARKVIPSVRPPVCRVQYVTLNDDAACNVDWTKLIGLIILPECHGRIERIRCRPVFVHFPIF